jgi:hypothetical protein
MNMHGNETVEGLAGLGYPGFGSGGRRSVMRDDGGGSSMPPHIEAAFHKEYDEHSRGVGGQWCISGHGAIYDRSNARGEHEALGESAIAGLGQRWR